MLAQGDHTDPDGDGVFDDLYFYMHDRLGSVRQVLDESAAVMHYYTYDPYGELLESASAPNAPTNAFLFTGQWYDEEIGQYYLRARMYDPALMRFTTRDPVKGQFTDALTLHAYLYCLNDPVNRRDLSGKWAVTLGGSINANFNFDSLFKGVFSEASAGLPAMVTGDFAASLIGHMFAPIFYMSMLGLDGSAGASVVTARDNHVSWKDWSRGWTFGYMGYASGGPSISTASGASFTFDVGFAYHAQKVDDLAGWYSEVGGGITTAVPIPWLLGMNTFNVTYGRSDKPNDYGEIVDLATFNFGWGVKSTIAAGEAHFNRGYTWTQTVD